MRYRHQYFHRIKNDFFEGIYYKISNVEDPPLCFAVIAGISAHTRDPHAFIQYYNESDGLYIYNRYPVSDFKIEKKPFVFTIGENLFSFRKIRFSVKEGKERIRAEIEFDPVYPWPYRFLSPGAMGPFSLVPFMECFYEIISMRSDCTGVLDVNGIPRKIGKGLLYIEKNWGISFPDSWIWVQSILFREPDTSLVVSLAHIPWLGRWFPGFIVGFLHRGKLFRFTTYNRSRLTDCYYKENKISLNFESGGYILKIDIFPSGGMLLRAPTKDGMNGICHESLTSRVTVSFYKKKGGKTDLIFHEKLIPCALELNGDVEKLLLGTSCRKRRGEI